jgi:ferrochelatase
MRKAVLMVNLGSPSSPEVPDVRRYLREFLSDPRVIDLPWLMRKALLELVILPFRPKHSSEAYKRVWTDEGSPLIAASRRQLDALQARVDIPVHLAMRYGEPSIRAAMEDIKRDSTQRLLLLPMFPHYAMSSYETAVARTMEICREMVPNVHVDLIQPFFESPGYIESLVASAKPFLDDGFQKLLFSFHSLPERHLVQTDPSHSHCLASRDCCHEAHPCHATCYRHQCLRTAELFARRAGIEARRCAISFQSRMRGAPWLSPGTFDTLHHFGGEKVETLLVITPSFVADCLETIDEIGNTGKQIFHDAGGGEMVVIPCLNDSPLFIDFLASLVHGWQDSLVEAR